MLIGKADLLKAITGVLPYHFRGREMNERVRGRFKLCKPSNLRLEPRGRVRFNLELTGKDLGIQVKGYGTEKRKAAQALAAGIVVEVLAQLSVNRKTDSLVVTPRCANVRLRRHDSSTYRSYLKSGLNQGLFNSKRSIKLPGHLRGKKAWLMTTENHVVLGY